MISGFSQIFVNNRYPLLLIVLTLAMLGVVEAKYPYFFLQDDNRVLFFPLFVDNFKAVASGEFPLFNFHQYLGVPTGIQAHALYLPNYIATGLSAILLGHYFGTMEILALFHIIVAVLGFYFLTRHFELNEACSCLGSLTWIFSGFVITVSNSWIHISGSAAYLPWILLFSLRLTRKFAPVDFVVLMLLKVALILVSHPQYALYVVTFELTVILMLTVMKLHEADEAAGGAFRQIVCCLLNNVSAAVISLPVLLQGAREAAVSSTRSSHLSWIDYSDGSYDIMLWLSGLIAPLRDIGFNSWNDLHFISHLGFIPLALIFIAGISIRKDVNSKITVVFFILAVFSLLWASNTFITEFIFHVPVYNKFRTPFKLVFFTSFFLSIVATFGAHRLYQGMSRIRIFGYAFAPVFIGLLLILHAANMLVVHTSGLQHSFIRFEDKIPIDEPLSEILKKDGGRIVSAGLDIPMEDEKALPGFSASLLGYNYASLWGVYHFGGYNALVPERNHRATLGIINSSVYSLPTDVPFEIPIETLEHYRVWGVRWYVIDARIPTPVSSDFRLIHSDKSRYLLRDDAARPMVYWGDHRDDNLIKTTFTANSVLIEMQRNSSSELVLNVLSNKKFSATIDGKPALLSETADSQMSVAVPAGSHQVKVKYSDRPFIISVIASACFSFLAALFVLFKMSIKMKG